MRIGIDTRDLEIAKTGTKTYLEELLESFPLVAPQHRFIPLHPRLPVRNGSGIKNKILGHIDFVWWKQFQQYLFFTTHFSGRVQKTIIGSGGG
jgi:hypothetical protein